MISVPVQVPAGTAVPAPSPPFVSSLGLPGSCPPCGVPLAGRTVVPVYVGTQHDRQPATGDWSGAAVLVHTTCTGPTIRPTALDDVELVEYTTVPMSLDAVANAAARGLDVDEADTARLLAYLQDRGLITLGGCLIAELPQYAARPPSTVDSPTQSTGDGGH